MKFLLVITICSSIYKTCMPPAEMYPMYNNYEACATAGHLNSLSLLRELGSKKVEADRVSVHFECKQMIGA
jgi:hypothetical protein